MLYGAPSRPVIKARRLLFVMPVTAHRVLARAPARAMTRGSPNRSPGALRPSWVRVGCDIRAKAGLSKTHPWPTFSSLQQPGVDRTCPGLELGEVVQAAGDPEVG